MPVFHADGNRAAIDAMPFMPCRAVHAMPFMTCHAVHDMPCRS